MYSLNIMFIMLYDYELKKTKQKERTKRKRNLGVVNISEDESTSSPDLCVFWGRASVLQ